ncbi:SDR family NAD(P)-dependent oxidoreductase [Marinicella sediminis]|uniref:SDR family NAD(P)-dependent oxidoreductase n=1 Tax=Marinicella sediminis TaxID=1792834 RepID=A0ABV7JAE4_9GAMM
MADHKVGGLKVLPGVAYLEMARAAVNQAMKVPPENSHLRLSQVVWSRPISAAEQYQGVDMVLTPLSTNEISYAVLTGCDETSAGQTHSNGKALWIQSSGAPARDLEGMKKRMEAPSLMADDCYRLFDDMALQYGPGFRGLEQVLIGDREVLAKIKLPQSAAVEQVGDFVIHPSLLDSAIQATIGLYPEMPEQPMLPFALDYLDVFSPCPEEVWAWAAFSVGPQTKDVQKIDIELLTPSGELCLKLHGLTSRMLNRQSRMGVQAINENMVYIPEWKEHNSGNTAGLYGQPCHVILAGLSVDVRSIEAQLPEVSVLSLDPDDKKIDQQFEAYATAVFEHIQKLLAEKTADEQMIQVFLPSDKAAILQDGLVALLKTVHAEFPQFHGQVIAVEGHSSADEIVRLIKDGSEDIGAEAIRCVNGKQYVQSYSEINLNRAGLDTPWRENGTYVITGGLGGIGLIFAEEIVSHTQRSNLVLLGRSALNDEKRTIIDRLQGAGAKVTYHQVDVADSDRMHDTFIEIKANHDQITGVLHCAGINRDNYILNKTAAEFKEVMAAKVKGTVNLCEQTRYENLDFFVLFSSVAASLGNAGQADYAAANGFMDSYAAYRQALVDTGLRKGFSLSINWPLWQDGGIGLHIQDLRLMESQTGMVAMPKAMALGQFRQALAGKAQRVMPLFGDRDKINNTFFAKPMIKAQVAAVEKPATTPTQAGNNDLLTNAVTAALLGHLSTLLSIAEEDLDTDTNLSDFGMDSIAFSELSNVLNQHYQLEINPTLFFEYQTLNEFVPYLIENHATELAETLGVEDTDQEVALHEPRALAGDQAAHQEVAVVNQSSLTVVPTGVNRFFTANHSQTNPQQVFQQNQQEPVAVIGVSAKFPGANDLDEFWDNLLEGKSSIREVPESRWDWKAFFGDPKTEKNKTNIKWGGFVDGVEAFDPLFFGISPTEAKMMDPQQRIMMMFIWSVIEDAGYSSASLAGSDTGIFVGTSNSGYSDLINHAGIGIEGYSSTSLVPSVGPNRMSYLLDLHGPSEPIETACSSSLVAIHRAVESIQSGACSAAITGGINIIITPWAHIAFSKAGMLCEDGLCKTFSENANGYVRGEGMGMLFLKRLSAAQEDGDDVYAVIRGTAENHGGRANTLTSPNPKAQSSLLLKAYRKAGIDPRTIGFIETHGTGTQLGDPIEINGLKNTFKALYEEHDLDQPEMAHCGLGSVKSNIGHLELAAGVAGVIKVMLQLKHGTRVKSLHCETVNPQILLANSPFFIQQENDDWPIINDDQGNPLPRRAGVSSFGFGGVNAHVILEEYIEPALSHTGRDHGLPQVVVLSAKTKDALAAKVTDLLDYLHGLPEANSLILERIAYTSQVGRDAMDVRLALMVHDIEELKEQLIAFRNHELNVKGVMYSGGKVKQDLYADFAADEDLQQTVETWINKGKHHKLAALWVKGFAFDWNELYRSNKPRRIHLPTYPFAEDFTWLETDNNDLYTTVEQSFSSHPLLHSNQSTLVEHKYLTDLDRRPGWLRKHACFDRPCVSASTYLELGCAALQHALPAGSQHSLQLDNVLWVGHEYTDQSKALLTRVSAAQFGLDHKNAIEFEVFNGQHEGAEANMPACQGRACHSAQTDLGQVDVAALLAELAPHGMNVEQHRKALTDAGFTVNASIDSLTGMFQKQDQLVFTYQRDRQSLKLDEGMVLPASILDLTLQMLASVLCEQGHTRNLHLYPFAMNHLSVLPGNVGDLIVSVQLNMSNQLGQETCAVDLTMMDGDGNCLLVLQGLELGAAELNANDQLQKTNKDWLTIAENWESAALDLESESWNDRLTAQSGAQLLVLSDQQGHADQLTALSQQIAEIIGEEESLWNLAHVPLTASGIDLDAMLKAVAVDRPVALMLFLSDVNQVSQAEAQIEQVYLTVQALLKHVASNHIQGYCIYHESGDLADVYRQSLAGLFKTAMLENPLHRHRCIAFNGISREQSDAMMLNVLQEWLCDDTQNLQAASVPMIRYDNGQRLVATVREEEIINLAADVPQFRTGATYLMVGGLGAAGEQVCRVLARDYRANLIILSTRSEAAVSDRLDQLRAAGATVHYHSVDVLNRDAVDQCIESLSEQGIQINGVLHMARRSSDDLIINKSVNTFSEIAAVKVAGTINIDEATKDHPIEFFLLYSSIASFGLRGAASYAYSTAFQNAFARHRNALAHHHQRTGRCLSICWGQWDVDGAVDEADMANRLQQFAAAGVDSISATDALEVMKLSLLSDREVVGYVPVTNKTKVLASLGLENSASSVNREIRANLLSFDRGEMTRQKFSEFLNSLQDQDISPALESEILAAIQRSEHRQQTSAASAWQLETTNQELQSPPVKQPKPEQDAPPVKEQGLVKQTSQHSVTANAMEPGADKKSYTGLIIQIMEQALGIDKTVIEFDQSFQSYGLDSITAIQMTNLLEKHFSLQIPPNWLIEYSTVNVLAEKILNEKKTQNKVA